MREKLNDNPVAQIAVIGVLVLIVGVFLLKSMGGGEESEGEAAVSPPAESAATTAGAEGAAGSLEDSTQASSSASVSAPSTGPLPDDIEAAYERGETVALLIYRPGGIDDGLVTAAATTLGGMPSVALFSTPASGISRYAAITGPLGVNQAPALVVISPRSTNGDGPASATVTYGFQSADELRQAVIDAGYDGPELTYAPK